MKKNLTREQRALRRAENRLFFTIIFTILAVLAMTLKVNTEITGVPPRQQLYVALHTSDIATTEEVQEAMREAESLWP